MDQFFNSAFFEKFKEQSLVVFMLALFTYYFYLRTEALEVKIADCNNKQIMMLEAMIDGLKANKDDLDSFKNSNPYDH